MMIGMLLNGRYEILEQIGSGGMAVVYKAQCKLLNRFVAIKVLRSELKSDSDFVDRFNIEARSAAALSHPNIVSVYDVGEQEGIHYIVMEYVDGVTLKEVIQTNGELDWKGAADICIQICSAIDHAHKRNIVHRDIKPHNIMINRDGNVKVTDFGIARAVSSTTRVAGGNVIGSVHYFSPEQARGDSVDSKSDIYSIGIVLYELLTGGVPFLGDSPYEVARKHIETVPAMPSSINNKVPIALDGVVMRALAKHPNDRYKTANHMLEDIKLSLKNPESNIASTEDMEATAIIPPIIDSKMLNKSIPDKNKKRADLIAIVLAVVTVVAIMGAGTYVFISMFGSKLVSDNSQTVPDVTGRLLEDVKQQLKDKKVTIAEVGSDYSLQYDEGYIITQQPAANSPLKLPLEIKVTISKGKKAFKINSYVNKDYRQAEQELNDLGAIVNTKFEKNSDLPRGVVIRQTPQSGEFIKAGDVVTFVISDGPDSSKIKVPRIIGLSQDVGVARIKETGFTVGEIDEGRSAQPKGTIVYQEPAAGTEVEAGTQISYVISTGVPTSEVNLESTATPTSKPTKSTPTPNTAVTPKSTPAPTKLYEGL